MQEGRKPSPDDVPGTFEQRVFIGGNYDFMPTLRIIAKFVVEISSPERTFVPVIPLDHDIAVEETMDRDLQMLARCKYAIFDLSDLGAQLVEMQVARQNRGATKSLLVYPVRERVNEPQRGRRTVLSFGLPHFGYLNFPELKAIVWRFLVDMPHESDVAPRVIYDPILDREIRRLRVLSSTNRLPAARALAEQLLTEQRYREALDLWLQLAWISHRQQDQRRLGEALQEAMKLSKKYPDGRGEVLYYQGAMKQQRPEATNSELQEAKRFLLEAEQYQPKDGRILQLLGFVLWRLGEKADAIEKTSKALDDREIPDPIVTIHALNNLGYSLCEEVEAGRVGESTLEEALGLTRFLPDYHRVFAAPDGAWLDTAGWVLYLKGRQLMKSDGGKVKAREILKEAADILEEAAKIDRNNTYIRGHLKAVRDLEAELK